MVSVPFPASLLGVVLRCPVPTSLRADAQRDGWLCHFVLGTPGKLLIREFGILGGIRPSRVHCVIDDTIIVSCHYGVARNNSVFYLFSCFPEKKLCLWKKKKKDRPRSLGGDEDLALCQLVTNG